MAYDFLTLHFHQFKIRFMFRKIILIFLLLNCTSSKLHAQAGTDFWFGFMENIGNINNLHMVVFIATDRPVSGTISVPLSGYSQSFIIAADSVLEIDLPVATVMHVGSEIVENKGVHLTTSDSVLVYLINAVYQSGDGTSVVPTQNIGKEYITLGYYSRYNPLYPAMSEFLIVAPQDSTIVSITPLDTTLGGVYPGNPFSITLNSGNSYQVKSLSDLSGSQIISNNPIAVFAGSSAAYIPSNPFVPGPGFANHLFEQINSIDEWGVEFITTPLLQRDSSDTYRILSCQDSTIISINGTLLDTLNQFEFIETRIGPASLILSNHPILVGQYSNSSLFDNTTGDPFQIVLLPSGTSYKKTYFKTYYNSSFSNPLFFVNIIAKSSSVSTVFMDGGQIPASAFTPISGTDFSYASFQATDGTHKIESDSGFIAYYYAFDLFDAFGMALTGYSHQYLTGLTPSQEEMMNLNLFPNPVDEILSISLPFSPLKESSLNVKIWDVNGREVLSKNISNSLTISVDVSELNSGIYFLVLSDISNKVIGKSKFCVNRR